MTQLVSAYTRSRTDNNQPFLSATNTDENTFRRDYIAREIKILPAADDQKN